MLLSTASNAQIIQKESRNFASIQYATQYLYFQRIHFFLKQERRCNIFFPKIRCLSKTSIIGYNTGINSGFNTGFNTGLGGQR